jgi:hypothetical protein
VTLDNELGIFGTLEDGRDTLMALRTYRESSDRWQSAYEELLEDYTTTLSSTKDQLKEIENNLQAEKERRLGRTLIGGGIAVGIILLLVH